MRRPYRDRTKVLARHWAEYGFGAPKITGLIYVLKLLFFYVLGGVLVATLTSGLDPLDLAAWWKDPILVYQKLVLWDGAARAPGVAGSMGSLAGHFKPFTAGWRHYARPGTVRVAASDAGQGAVHARRRAHGGLTWRSTSACSSASLRCSSRDLAGDGLNATGAIVPIIVFLVALGLRDKVFFLAARGEQYLPALIFFAFYPFVDISSRRSC